MIFSALPGIILSLNLRYLTAAFKSTIAAGALPMYCALSLVSLRPLTPGDATT